MGSITLKCNILQLLLPEKFWYYYYYYITWLEWSNILYYYYLTFNSYYYRIGGIFRGEKFSWISRFRKNYTQKTKFYKVHTLFLTDLRKFNPTKCTTYTVLLLLNYCNWIILQLLLREDTCTWIKPFDLKLNKVKVSANVHYTTYSLLPSWML